MKNSRMKNLIVIFCCIIAIFATFVMKHYSPLKNTDSSEKKEDSNTEISTYLDDNQLESIDDSLYNENATDE